MQLCGNATLRAPLRRSVAPARRAQRPPCLVITMGCRIGCADARVPANELIGLRPGEVLVQRNVGNIASFKDMNLMSCLEYAVAGARLPERLPAVWTLASRF